MELWVDCRMASNSGVGVFIRNMVSTLVELHPDWTFHLLGVPASAMESMPQGARIYHLPLSAKIYSISEQFKLGLATRGRDGVFWSPHYNAALFSNMPLVVTVHDVTPIAGLGFVKGWMSVTLAKIMLHLTRHRAAAITFVSEFSRQEFKRLVGEPRGVTELTYNALPSAALTKEGRVRRRQRPYLVFVGNLKPNKNLATLLHAMPEIRRQRDVDLVVVGNVEGFRNTDNEALRIAETFGDFVEFTGHVTDEELYEWLAGAEILVFPSLYEGFGIPPLEAMALEVPVVAARTSSIPEVCGDAAVYFDAKDPLDLSRAVSEILADSDRRQALIQLGLERHLQFNWKQSATALSQVIERIS